MGMTNSRVMVRLVTEVRGWGNDRLIPDDPPTQHGSLPEAARAQSRPVQADRQ